MRDAVLGHKQTLDRFLRRHSEPVFKDGICDILAASCTKRKKQDHKIIKVLNQLLAVSLNRATKHLNA